jgi:hypothetical protein
MVAAIQPYLWINQHGKRFCDENIVYNFIFQANVISRQKGGYDFTIVIFFSYFFLNKIYGSDKALLRWGTNLQ